jgi:dihydrofolate reductase
MGRKTWESIPPRFRPLKGRLNLVLSRSCTAPESWASKLSDSEPVHLPSLAAAIEGLGKNSGVGKAFVIGGAEVYKAALECSNTKRILLTRVLTDFECDTFFPLALGDGEKSGEWQKKTKTELDVWVGETVPEGIQKENGVEYVYEMYERE